MTCLKHFAYFADDEYENILSCFGINLVDLPKQLLNDLYILADLKLKTGIVETDITYLREWYCHRVEDNMKKETTIRNIEFNIKNLERDLSQTTKTIEEADK